MSFSSPPPTPAACCSPTPAIVAANTATASQLIGVELIVPEQAPARQRPPSEIIKARIRLVIESVFSTLKRQMRLEDHLAKTLAGLAQRVVQRLLALTLSMLINTILGRPPRALAAYDGR